MFDLNDDELTAEEALLLDDDHPCWCDCGCVETAVFPDELCEACQAAGHGEDDSTGS